MERFTITQEKPRLAYDGNLEIEEYKSLSVLEGKIPQEEYANNFLRWKQEKIFNLATNLGERFNAQLFEVNYPIESGRLMNPFRDEFMLDSIVCGQQKRLSSHFNHDDKRELCEVVTFSAVESYFANRAGRLVVPSPEGGSFGSNFVDVYSSFTQGGKDFVKMQRFPTDLSLSSHWKAAQKLTSELLGEQAVTEKDVQIKTLVLETNSSIEELRKIYTPERKAISIEKYQALVRVCKPLINNYIDSIVSGENEEEIQRNLNATLKFADIYMGCDVDARKQISRQHVFTKDNVGYAAAALGRQEVREVATGCGLQGTSSGTRIIGRMDLIRSALFSGSRFNPFSEGEEDRGDFPCPQCDYTITYGAGITECPNCGLAATCS